MSARIYFALCPLLAACGDDLAREPLYGTRGYDAGAPPLLACTPNLDGKIDAHELAPRFDSDATFLVSALGSERAVDIAGAAAAGGRRAWRFLGKDASDAVVRIGAKPLRNAWYAPSFAEALDAFTMPFDAAGRLDAIYTHRGDGVRLHGFASVEPDGVEGKTLIVYAEPVVVYRFPLEVGSTWRATGTVRNGFVRGVPYAARDTYEIAVDGDGEVVLPDLVFERALRVRTNVSIEPAAGTPSMRRHVTFLFECLGEIARASSHTDEQAPDFTRATELRRLALP